MTPLKLPQRPKILVVALRRLGDVLLTTPLIRSLRRAWPDATIDTLVFADTAGILAGNPDLDSVVTMPVRPSAAQSLALAARLWRRYALAISTQCGDRPSFFAFVAGRVRVGPVEDNFDGRLKRFGYRRSVAYAPGVHRVEEMLRLADALGIARVAELVAPRAADSALVPDGDYAVIHAAPMFRYKQWTEDGWRALAAALTSARPGRGRDRRPGQKRARLSRRGVGRRRFDPPPRRSARLARACRAVGTGASLYRPRHLGDSSCRRCGMPDGRALRAD